MCRNNFTTKRKAVITMADEIFKDEQLTDSELDNVAGGTYQQSYDQMMFLSQQMGINFFPNDRDASVNKLGGLYQHAGIKFVAHNSDKKSNEYYNAVTGEKIEAGPAFQHLVNTINTLRAQGVVIN